MITLWHSEHVKVSRLWKVTGVTKLLIAGWWSGCSKSEFGMVIVASNSMIAYVASDILSLSATQGCAFKMRCGIADSTCCPAVAWSEALSALAAQDMILRDRAAGRALIVIGLTPLLLHRPGYPVTTLLD